MTSPPQRDPGEGSRRRRARRRFRRLLRLYPAAFRKRFGDEMEESFLRLLEIEGERWGRWGRVATWGRAVWNALREGIGRRLRRLRRPGRGSPGDDDGRGGRRLMTDFVADVRFAVRGLLRRPVLLATATLTLALGIGATTAVFTLFNGLILKPFPYPDAHRLVMVWAENLERGWTDTDANLADAWDWRSRSGVFEDLGVWNEVSLNLTGLERPERLDAVETTHNFLDVLEIEPALGRGFRATDAREGEPAVAILSHGFWQRRFGGEAGSLGSTLTLDGRPTTVVGILGPEHRGLLDEPIDLMVAMKGDPAAAERGNHTMEAIGRLRRGVELPEAQRAVNRVALRLQEEHPETNEGWTAKVEPVREELLGDIAKQASYVLLGAVGFVLLMACVNIANLLLARADGRRDEIAIRSAVGAGRGRIVRQLLTESLVLGLAGGAVGMALAYWGSRAIVAGLPANVPPLFDFGVDGTVLAFALAVSLGSVVIFGLVPALRGSRHAASELRRAGRGSRGGPGGARFGGTLVVVQTALAVVLLVGGGVLMRSVMEMQDQEMGFEPGGVLTLAVNPPKSKYPDDPDVVRFYDRVLERVRALPGVEAAGAIQSIPLGGSNWAGTIPIPGRVGPDGQTDFPARFGYVTPGYFRAMGIEVLRGRGVGPGDRADAPLVAVVNRAFVERYLPGSDPLERTLGSDELSLRVVGVVQDHLSRGIDRPPEPTVFFSALQQVPRGRYVAVRADGGRDPAALAPAVQEAVWAVDPDQPVFDVMTMEERVAHRVGGYRLIAQLMGGFALLSLLLGAVGIYGVTAYGVARRTGEIGVRIAMGAQRDQVVGMVLGQGLRRTLLGLALGLVAAFLLTRALAGLLVGVSPTDPATFTVVTVVLLGVAALGSWLPARRAARVDPVRALATE